MSSVLLAGPPTARPAAAGPPAAPPGPPAASECEPSRSGTLAVIAGVGVLLLAMGVGVLIGRAGSSSGRAAPAQVITVGGASSPTAAGAASEAPFTGDWPSGTKGFTVQLQTLPSSGTTVAAVGAAKTAASAKGAKNVGALSSGEYSSLTAGNYVIYSGVYHARAEAQKALASLRKSFPAATVISVSNGGGAAAASESGAAGAGGSKGTGNNIKEPAPPSVLENLNKAKGKSYEEKSKNLPDVVSTG